MRKWILTILALVLISLLIIDYKNKLIRKETIDNKVNLIIEQNQHLIRENDSIRSTIDHYESLIEELKIEELRLKYRTDTLNRNLKNIKSLYEQALNRPDNWTNDSIRWYFTNF